MTPLADLATRWPRISALLDEALELPPADRAQWLDRLDDAPVELKDTLRRLLEARPQVDTKDFLAELPKLPPAAGATTGAHEPSEGALVGPYRLVRELGHGGMGSVWLAERSDGQLKRQVALKLPHMTWAGGLAERMARERDILATLEHPNIARLYDAGIDTLGRPWMAMEYVQGRAIDAYARERQLDVPACLALLQQVCSAVAYAHSRLVIHRDLKPSNVLVTDEGEVRLLDFGIAKLVAGERADATALTHAVGQALTPDYASPEQLLGQPLGTASDVYSLGVVAYELLTGRRPYRLERRSATELDRALDAIPLANTVAADAGRSRELRGDVDAILNRALKTQAAERYPTADALSQDIARHLAHQPVLARPDSPGYRLRRWARRHRLAVGAGSVAVAALLTGTAIALWQAAEARRSEAAAREALAREGVVGTLYVETLSTVAAWPVATFGEKDSVARELKAKVEDFEKRHREQPELRLAVLQNATVLLPYLGDDAGSLDLARRYLALLKELRANDERPLEAYLLIGLAHKQLGRPTEVETTFRQGLAEYPRSAANAGFHASVSLELAKLVLGKGQVEEARRMLDETAAQADGLVSHKRWEVRHTRGRLLLGYDDVEALRLLQQAKEEYSRDPAAFPINLGMNDVFIGLAALSIGLSADAQRAFTDGRRIFDAGSGLGDRDSIIAFGGLMASLTAQGRFEQARAGLLERLAEVDKRPGDYAAEHRSMLRARLLELEIAHGDARAASDLLLLEPKDAPRLWRNFELPLYVRAQAKALIWNDRADDAARITADFIAALPPARSKLPPVMQMRMARAEAELAGGRADAAAELIAELQATLAQEKATRTWLSREAQEWAAVARLRRGHPAADALGQLQAFDSSLAADVPLPPGEAATIDSTLRRAELLVAAGRKGEALEALGALKPQMDKQHLDSPRRGAARRLATLAAS